MMKEMSEIRNADEADYLKDTYSETKNVTFKVPASDYGENVVSSVMTELLNMLDDSETSEDHGHSLALDAVIVDP
jgi:hypothetical protein